MTHKDYAIWEAWIQTQLATIDERLVALEPVQSAETGYVLCVKTEKMNYFFKVCAPVFAHEPPVMAAVATWFPEAIPGVIAHDVNHRWLLMADAGESLREMTKADGDITRWEGMLRGFAKLQQSSQPYVDNLLALGMWDRRPQQLITQYQELLATPSVLCIGKEDGISEEEYARLQVFTPHLVELCEKLADYHIPQMLHHDDFHAANTGVKNGQYRFFDWGEACVAHPFYSLMITLRSAKFTFKQDETVLNHLRDVYLACWYDYESPERLLELLATTHQLAALCRTLTWWQVVKHTTDETQLADIADAVPYWISTFLNNTPLD